jgi:hypothetical protein
MLFKGVTDSGFPPASGRPIRADDPLQRTRCGMPHGGIENTENQPGLQRIIMGYL